MTVSSCDNNDAADYCCVVAGSCNSTTSNSASLTVHVPRDFDRDGDVDQSDFGHFQACLTGTGVTQNDPSCQDADLDGDSDVDTVDLQQFLSCLSGPGTRARPDCVN